MERLVVVRDSVPEGSCHIRFRETANFQLGQPYELSVLHVFIEGDILDRVAGRPATARVPDGEENRPTSLPSPSEGDTDGAVAHKELEHGRNNCSVLTCMFLEGDCNGRQGTCTAKVLCVDVKCSSTLRVWLTATLALYIKHTHICCSH